MSELYIMEWIAGRMWNREEREEKVESVISGVPLLPTSSSHYKAYFHRQLDMPIIPVSP